MLLIAIYKCMIIVLYTDVRTGITEFHNPDRGWYHHTEGLVSNFVPLDYATLTQLRRDSGFTLLFRSYVLDTFVMQPISNETLQMILADFDTARRAFFKLILRFSYTTTLNDPPSRGDASKTIILQHIAQLEPILHQHSDVILTLQHGFIGTWGEGYYTDHFGDAGVITPQQYQDRLEVYNALLDSTTKCSLLQVRTWNFKTRLTGTSTPISMQEAYTCGNSSRNVAGNARTGIHNDCFLASETDFGTWDDSDVDKPLFSEHSRYTIVGGETCNPSSSRNACPIALQELGLFHFTYLNSGYHLDVLSRWTTEGCFDTVSQRLGYRLVLLSSTFHSAARRGCSMSFNFTIRNYGFAAPSKRRLLNLVLEKGNLNVSLSVEGTNIDPRFWIGNETEHTIQGQVQLPADMESGIWSVYVVITDFAVSLKDLPEYNILFVNQPASAQLTGMNSFKRNISVL